MAQRMSAATSTEDWKALAALNTLLAAELPQLAAQGSWSPAERAALEALRQVHEEAVQRCGRATSALGQRLYDMQHNKEGWIAYALDSDNAETGIQA
ncbi:MAG: hypothetical protein ACEQSK_14955 [Sphingomonadaceae bacterium]